MTLGTLVYTIIGCLTSRDGICKSEDCIKTANMLTTNMMNTSPAYKPNACINFYEYACGKFRNETPLPQGLEFVILAYRPRHEIEDRIAELLGQSNSDNDPASLQRVRLQYHQCLQSATAADCVRTMIQQYPKAIVYLLVQELDGYEARRKVQKLLENLKESFVKKINDSWLSDDGKAEAIRKIRRVGSMIFFTDDMVNPETLDQPDVPRPFNVLGGNIKYVRGPHIIGVPIMATRIPFYNFGLESMDAGGMAHIMAHELGHMLDIFNAPFDSNNQRSGWWTPWMQQQYSARAERFIHQYNQLSDRGVQINGDRTLSENIQDNVGFQVALDAYRSHAKRQKKLIHFEDFSPEQLFTLASASIYCERLTERATQRWVSQFIHAPGLARVNGIVMNSPEFSDIWNCPPNSPMNPAIKNDIWGKEPIPSNV